MSDRLEFAAGRRRRYLADRTRGVTLSSVVLDRSGATELSTAEQLQQLSQLLAAAHRQDEVLMAALQPAVAALSALSGVVLLLDATGQQLKVTVRQGVVDDCTVWQDGPLDPALPSGDAVMRRQALYFGRAGEMVAAYPKLEEKTGGVAAVSSAVLPLLLDDRALGVLVLEFREPHVYTEAERRFLMALALQTSVALDRVQVLARLRHSEASFRRMVEVSPVAMAVGSLDGGLTLVNDAYLELLGYTRAEYEAGQIDWQALTPEEYRAQDQQAFEAAFSQGVSTTYEKEMLTRAGERLPLELTLIRHDATQVVGYLKDLRVQRAQERVVAGQASSLLEEQAASQAFMTFTEAASHTTDLQELAPLARVVLQDTLPGSSVGFYELEGARWYPRYLSAEMSPELQTELQAGVPADLPAFAEMVQTRAPVFVDRWSEPQSGVRHSGVYGQAAFYPIERGGQVGAALVTGIQRQGTWSDRSREVALAVGHSFSLLYDRIAATQEMQRQNAEVENRNRALETFSTLTRVLDVRLGRYELIRRTQDLVLTLLPPGYAAYWEPEHGFWRLKSQVGDAGTAALQAAIDVGFPVGATPTLDTAMNTGEPYFVEIYDHETDVAPELVSHLNAVSCLPIFIRGQFVGIFNLPMFHTRVWNAPDRAVLISAVQSLTLALEGAQSLAELESQAAELAASNSSLQSANEELEAFTYSASHDLRTPVRHVMGFAELAEKALSDTPNAKAQQHLETVKKAALRMTSLIDGMLLLSRSGRQELQVQSVDLNALATQARRDATSEFGGHPVRWQIGNLPTVQGDAQLLQQVMTNLLSNAVKYSAKREVSEISVSAQSGAAEWIISVQDNGVGFHPDYAQRLFGIFQRLHTEKDFKGVGVGLATVKRIVQKHGGRVFAESDGTSGATFGFTLSKSH